MFGPREYHVSNAKLTNSPQPLDLLGLQQVHERAVGYTDEAVNRICEALVFRLLHSFLPPKVS